MEKKKQKFLKIPDTGKEQPPEKFMKGMSAEKFNKFVDEFDLDENDMKDIADGIKKYCP